jgi:hypothetical protein
VQNMRGCPFGTWHNVEGGIEDERHERIIRDSLTIRNILNI